MRPPRKWESAALAAADKRHVWHPFTPMRDWCAPEHEPLILVEGEGALLRDSEGREYIDGNSSIWTNIHGHNHPRINAAIRDQLEAVAHTSFLGFTNPAAIELAEAIVRLFPPQTLSRVFFSDDGSTGMEVALRMVEQHWRLRGSARAQFVSFRGAYHGDTAGAASLGANAMFKNGPEGWYFPSSQVGSVSELEAIFPDEEQAVAAVVIEPLIQGAAGMKLWPSGTLAALRKWCDRSGALLIADEVMTGFGRTGTMFAFEQENAIPDILVLGKALTGGYLPLALTVVTEKIFEPFLGEDRSASTLFYGHSYTGNALACAAAKASLEIFETEDVLRKLADKIEFLRATLAPLRGLPAVLEIRQCGFIAAVELKAVAGARLGAAVCEAARQYGLLTRPIHDTIVLMLPYCVTEQQISQAVEAIRLALQEVCDKLPTPARHAS
ncbi:MAG: adenosylmethionine--8-amino-7-oxononanoate transaminase [Chthoniobacterales bacterium]